MHPPQLDAISDEVEILAHCEPWVMVRGQPGSHGDPVRQVFVVWLSEQVPDENILNACQKLADTPDLFVGLSLAFETTPEFGFVLNSAKGWGFETPELTQKTLENMIWELNRLCRE